MPVYDDQKAKTPSADELHKQTGIDPREAANMDENARSAHAQSILDQERAAAAGGNRSNDTDSGSSSSSGSGEQRIGSNSLVRGQSKTASGEETAEAREFLRNREDNLFQAGEDDKPGGWKSRARNKVAIFSAIAGLLGFGGGFALLGVASGPAQFVQISKRLQELRTDSKNDQLETRVMGFFRYNNAFKAGMPQNARLSILGKRIQPKIEARFSRMGVTAEFGRLGVLRAYTVDPAKLKGDIFDRMTPADRTNDGARAWFERNMGIKAEVIDGKLRINTVDPAFDYKANRRLARALIMGSGANRVVGAIQIHYAGVWAGMKGLWRAIDRKAAKTFEDWLARHTQLIEAGTESVRPGLDPVENEEGPDPQAEENADNIDETGDDADEARGSPDDMDDFKNDLRNRVGNGLNLLGIVDVVCLLYYSVQKADIIKRANVDIPSQRVALELMSLGSQITAGTPDLEGKEAHKIMQWFASRMNDKEFRTSFFDALSFHRAAGRPGGHKLAEERKLGSNNDAFSQFFKNPAVSTALNPVCAVAANALTLVVFGVAAIVTGGATAFAIQALIGVVAGPLLIDGIAHTLAGKQIDPATLVGAQLGGVADQGAFSFANGQAMSYGGRPLTAKQSAELQAIQHEETLEEFRQKSLAHRVFAPDDPMSVFGQVIQKQRPEATANVAMYASGLLNIGNTLGSLLSQPFKLATVGAAPMSHDFGEPDFGFTPEELAAPEYELNYENANRAVELLDNQEEEGYGPDSEGGYVHRSKVCFGVTIEKRPMAEPDPEQPDREFWSVSAPKEGEMPLYSTVKSGYLPAEQADAFNHECTSESEDWKVIRFFILDNQAMNSFYCWQGDADDPDTKQACIDVGIQTVGGGSGGATSVGSGPTCNNGRAQGAVPVGYQLIGCEDFTNGLGQFKPYGGGGGSTVSGTFRTVDQCKVENDLLILIQDNENGTCGGLMEDAAFSNKYAYWRVRMKITGPESGAHPVLIAWPTNDDWPAGAEYDYVEVNTGEECLGAFLHYPNHQPITQEHATKCPFNLNEFHEYGFEWLPGELIGYVDGEEWFRYGGQVAAAPYRMRQTIQLDNLSGNLPSSPATMEIDWAHMYAKPEHWEPL